ncbi:MAG: GNAT family N-acetyltransferase [Chloroflexi bacterium]|nr:GNAT family N-acetyltransferase [Chloroflexota bacterium]MBI3173408.1 GNAT family N-acetyltransferase [Chloroflexota bacterium]
MNEEKCLGPDLILRPARLSDINALAKLVHDVAEMEGDSLFVLTAEELANEWKSEGFKVERDVFVVETRDGRLVGSEEFYNERGHYKLKADGCVHPEFRGRGIGSSLLEKVEERAQTEMELAAPDVQVVVQSLINNKDEAGHSLLRNNGYSPVRYYWRMEIKLQEAPAPVTFPAGIELRPFVKEEHAIAVWQADNEAFRDHWGSHDRVYEEWSHGKFGNPNFDPTLWMIAWDGDEVAGFSQNRFRKGIGWIGTIAVRRPWRGKGLGIALLRHTFGEFHKRGTTTIGLGVDSANLTGATRLYQRAGMTVAGEFAMYEKELRAGKEG